MTSLKQSPFYLLGVTTRDDRHRIIELAEEKSLTLDSDVCAKARSDLTTPRNRLAIEMAWLPGISPKRADVLVKSLHRHPEILKGDASLPPLAKANLLADVFDLLDPDMDAELWCEWIVDFANTVELIDAENVLRDINEERSVSGISKVQGVSQVESELKDRNRFYTEIIKAALNKFASSKLVDVVTRVVENTTDTGQEHGAIIVHDLIERYEEGANRYLQPEAENIKKLADAIRQVAPRGEIAVKPLVDKLIQVVSKWDSVAQPIQLSVKARGLNHDLSHEVANTIRSLGIELFNKHDMLDTANRLTKTLQELFAELAEMVEKLDQDSETLDGIHEVRKEAQKRGAEWAREITFQAEMGLVFKDTLRISPNGIEWKSCLTPLNSVTGVGWGATRKSINGIPSGTDFFILYCDIHKVTKIQTNREGVYSTFVDKLWNAVGVRLLTEMLEGLRAGQHYQFGDAILYDQGMQLTKNHIFSADEQVKASWDQLHIWSSNGSLYVGVKGDDQAFVALPYQATNNAHVLEAAIRMSFKQGAGRLSSILDR